MSNTLSVNADALKQYRTNGENNNSNTVIYKIKQCGDKVQCTRTVQTVCAGANKKQL